MLSSDTRVYTQPQRRPHWSVHPQRIPAPPISRTGRSGDSSASHTPRLAPPPKAPDALVPLQQSQHQQKQQEQPAAMQPKPTTAPLTIRAGADGIYASFVGPIAELAASTGASGCVWRGCVFARDGEALKYLPLHANPTGWMSAPSTSRGSTDSLGETVMIGESLIHAQSCFLSLGGIVIERTNTDANATPVSSCAAWQVGDGSGSESGWAEHFMKAAPPIAFAACAPLAGVSDTTPSTWLVHGGLTVSGIPNPTLYQLQRGASDAEERGSGNGDNLLQLTPLGDIDGLPPLVGHHLVVASGDLLLIFGGICTDEAGHEIGENFDVFVVERSFLTAQAVCQSPPVGFEPGYYYFFDSEFEQLWWIGPRGKRCVLDPFGSDAPEWEEIESNGDEDRASENLPARGRALVAKTSTTLFVIDSAAVWSFSPSSARFKKLLDIVAVSAVTDDGGTTRLPHLPQAAKDNSQPAQRPQQDQQHAEQQRQPHTARARPSSDPARKPPQGHASIAPKPRNGSLTARSDIGPRSYYWEQPQTQQEGIKRLRDALLKHRRKAAKKARKARRNAKQATVDPQATTAALPQLPSAALATSIALRGVAKHGAMPAPRRRSSSAAAAAAPDASSSSPVLTYMQSLASTAAGGVKVIALNSVAGAPSQLTCRDLFYVREGLRTLPEVSGIDISGKALGHTETQFFVDMISKFMQLVRVVDVATTYTPAAARREVQEQTERNAAAVEELKDQLASERKARKAAARERRRQQRELTVRPFVKKRLLLEHVEERVRHELQHAALRFVPVVMRERADRALLQQAMHDHEAEVVRSIASYAALVELLHALEGSEPTARDAVAQLRVSELVGLARDEREARREAMARQRLRHREMRLQREALEKEEKVARVALRQCLDTDGAEMLRWHDENFTPLLRAHRARIEAERVEKERQRLEREAQEREEIRRQARIDAIMQLQAKQRETLQRDQSIMRDRVTMEENKESILLRDRIAYSFDDALRRQRMRERSQMRATCAKAPSVISFARWHSDRSFAEGSTGAVAIIPENCALQVKPVKPKFMAFSRAREESVVSIMSASGLGVNPNSSLPASPIAGSLSSGAASPSSAPPLLTSLALLEPPGSGRLEPAEMSNETWLQQKNIFLGATATFELQQFAEGDALVLNDLFLLHDASTDAVFDVDGRRVGTMTFRSASSTSQSSFGAGESPCATTVDLAVSYMNSSGTTGLEQLIHAVGFRRYSDATDRSPCSGSVTIKMCHLQPRDDQLFDDASVRTFADRPSFLEALFVANDDLLARQLVVEPMDVELAKFTAVKLLDSVRLRSQRSVALPTFPPDEGPFKVVYSSYSANFSFAIGAPIICVPHYKQSIEYEEGQGDGPLLAPLMQPFTASLLSAKNALNGFSLYVDMGPCLCATDYIWLSETSAVTMRRGHVLVNDTLVAKVRQHGCLFDHALQLNEPTRVEMEIVDGIPAASVELLLRAIVFRNDTRNPSDAKRTIRIGLFNAINEVDSSAVFRVSVRVEDDLTVIDFGVVGAHVAYRYPATISQALRDVVRIPPCYFGLYADVFDADTTEFDGGSLIVELLDATIDDIIRLEPPPGSALSITDDNDIVFAVARVGRLIEHSTSKLEVSFDKCSIDILRELIHTFDYVCTAPITQLPFIKQPRVVETRFTMGKGGGATVTSRCNIRLSLPLIQVPPALSKFSYRENAGLVRIGTAEVASADDDGWDGGYLCMDMVSGWTDDDRLVLKEDDELQLVDFAETSLRAPHPPRHAKKSATVVTSPVIGFVGGDASSSSGSTSAREAFNRASAKAVSIVADDHAAAPSTRGGDDFFRLVREASSATSASASPQHPPQSHRGSVASNSSSSGNLVLSTSSGEAKQRIRELARQRREEMAARRREVLADAREMTKRIALQRRRVSEPENAVMKVVMLQGRRIGHAIISHKVINVFFDDKLGGERITDRGREASIRKKDANAVLKRLHYINESENPYDLHKVVTVTACDGLPHSTTTAVEIDVQADDDATELRRLSTAAKSFRSRSQQDLAGFRLFGDVTLHDPDTFFFNGGFLAVELVGGGDAKTDQLGIATAVQQVIVMSQAKAGSGSGGASHRNSVITELPPAPLQDVQLLHVSDDRRTLLLGTEPIAELILDAPNAEGHSNLMVRFIPAPKGSKRLPSSHEEAQATPGIVTISIVERVLQAVTYTSTGAKVKPGARVYQARVGFEAQPESIGKLKLTVNVVGPLLWNPDFGGDVVYKEGKPPVVLFPKMILNLTDKELVREGFIEVEISSGFEADNDILGFDFKKTDFSYDPKKSDRLEAGGQFIGKVSRTPQAITVAFDFSSKVTTRQLQQLLKSFIFSNASDNPSTQPRVVRVRMNCKAGGLCEVLVALTVLSTDTPAEIVLKTQQLEVVRCCGPLRIAADADVVDPDTNAFGPETYIDVEVKGGASSDIIASALVPNEAASADVVIPGDNPNVIGKLVRRGGASQCRLQVTSCTLGDLQAFVRSLTLELSANQHDRSSRKGVLFEIKSGDGQAMKANLAVDVVAQLIDLPTPLPPIRITSTAEMELFASAVIPAAHFMGGGTITVESRPSLGWYELRLGSKQGLSIVKKKDVMLEGKKVASIADDCAFTGGLGTSLIKIAIPKSPQGALVAQKIVRSFVIESGRVLTTTLELSLAVRDDARNVEKTITSVIEFALPS